MVVVALAQILMAFSFSALAVSIGGVVESFDAPATTVGTALVVYSLGVAGFIMLGAKVGQIVGAKRAFLAAVASFGVSMVLVARSRDVGSLIAAQGLAGDAGALRGTANNLAAAVSTAAISALVVSLLAARIAREVARSPIIPSELAAQVDLDNVNFVSNDRLAEALAGTTATAAQAFEAQRLNEEARLRALKLGFLVLAGLPLLAIVPAGRLPGDVVPITPAPAPEAKAS